MSNFFSELKRRRVVRVGLAYLVAAWVAVQVSVTVAPIIKLPDSVARVVLVVALLGFPAALVLAWYFERTDQGLVKDEHPAESRLAPRVAFGVVIAAALALSAWVLLRGGDEIKDDVIAIAPFRVTGATELAYLREGLVDLLAIRLSGEAKPRAVDPRTLMAAWRREAGPEAPDLEPRDALKVARAVGAGLMLMGEVTALGDRVTLSARLYDAESGREAGEPASIDGRIDDLAVLADALARQMLLSDAGVKAPEQYITSSFPALHAFLAGRAAYRRGRMDQALAFFNRALEHDSLFAMAAVQRVEAANWVTTDRWSEYVAHAHRLVDRMSNVDRWQLYSTTPRGFPERHGFFVESFIANDSGIALAPDRPELLFARGDLYLHHGPRVGLADSRQHARAAFDKLIALDSSHSLALEHRAMLAALEADSATARALAERHYALVPESELNDLLRWLVGVTTGDSAAVRRARNTSSLIARQNIAGAALITGLSVEDAEIASRLGKEAADRLSGRIFSRLQVGFSLGRAPIIMEAIERGAALPPNGGLEAQLIDEVAAAGIKSGPLLEHLQARLARFDAAAIERAPARERVYAWYYYALWQLVANQDLTAASGALQHLRALPGETAANFASLMDALVAVAAKSPDARTKVERADSLSLLGPAEQEQSANYWLARSFESLGEHERGLRAVRRRMLNFSSGLPALAAMLALEGRLAEASGDRDSAIKAYRHFLALRYNPSAEFRSQTEEVRAALARLVQEAK